MLTGNKGEWSEIYVFLKLIAEGKLYAADSNLNALSNVYYPILKILREDRREKREYILDRKIFIYDGRSGIELLAVPIRDFIEKSKELFKKLKEAEGRSFGFDEIEEFLHSIDIYSLKALKYDKSDIRIVVHDLNTGLKPELGFSIKSLLGKNATLFNPGETTNFIYKIIGTDTSLINIETVNQIKEQPKIFKRIEAIKKRRLSLKFIGIESKMLELNLRLIDSDLPEILAELLLLKYTTQNSSSVDDLISQLIIKNPLKFDLSLQHPFYEHKVKNFLTDCALGMTPSKLWEGKYSATGGIIIVKESGELVCYHIYNRSEFQEYLYKHTRFEQASTSRYEYGYLFYKKGEILFKLNLQIRFK